ncbi:MAG: methyltransferase domain-containing protein [Opitutaceae bacterium]
MDAEEYPKLAAVEDTMWYFRALHAHVARALAKFLPRASRVDLVDAGCGTGGLIRRSKASHPQWRWTGVDLSPIACGLARERVGENTPIVEGSVTALPLADASCDVVTSLDVIYHVDDDEAALREFHRILRPGGIVVINVPAYPWLWSYHDVATHARRRYTRAQLLAKLRAAGFNVVGATYWNAVFFPLVVLRRKLLPAPRGRSDVQLFSPPVEAAFHFGMAIERTWLGALQRLPFGSSIFAVARKPLA